MTCRPIPALRKVSGCATMRSMELVLIILFFAFLAFVAYSPEAVLQIFLAMCWLMMGIGVLFELGRLAFYGIKALL